MRKSPESEMQATLFADIGEKCSENLAKQFADFRPSLSKENSGKSNGGFSEGGVFQITDLSSNPTSQ